jgi:hypothetical protein
MSHVDDELAEFEREIEQLAQSGGASNPAPSADVPSVVAESVTLQAAPSSHLFISNAHAYAPPQLNAPAPAVVAETNKPTYQP